MFKFSAIMAIIAIVVVVLSVTISAEPPRFRQTRRLTAFRVQNQRKFSRQEAAVTSAPYPAAGVTPEIPFNLPNEPDQTYGPPEPTPDQTYGPPEPTPDQTYGPPESTPDQTYGPPDASEAAATEPDTTYGPPETEEPAAEEVPAEEAIPADAELVSLNIIQPRSKFVRSRLRSSPQQRQRIVQPRGRFVEIIRSEPILVYTLH